ncbi:hypothetical protein VP01_1930g1 [Puccinia sorghi]|uniref:Uncharacterized protein n=1 Tax=Puccinia sorghi TaxID=27349 RepID=A0A0L6VCD4_9BASI|nr:hypothetical protein VP01_1930g1 [Puccinia sorghi]
MGDRREQGWGTINSFFLELRDVQTGIPCKYYISVSIECGEKSQSFEFHDWWCMSVDVILIMFRGCLSKNYVKEILFGIIKSNTATTHTINIQTQLNILKIYLFFFSGPGSKAIQSQSGWKNRRRSQENPRKTNSGTPSIPMEEEAQVEEEEGKRGRRGSKEDYLTHLRSPSIHSKSWKPFDFKWFFISWYMDKMTILLCRMKSLKTPRKQINEFLYQLFRLNHKHESSLFSILFAHLVVLEPCVVAIICDSNSTSQCYHWFSFTLFRNSLSKSGDSLFECYFLIQSQIMPEPHDELMMLGIFISQSSNHSVGIFTLCPFLLFSHVTHFLSPVKPFLFVYSKCLVLATHNLASFLFSLFNLLLGHSVTIIS